jgi:hypothetical protein
VTRQVGFEQVIGLWEDGQARLRAADVAERPALERVVDEIVVELRRRLGGSFTVDELAADYLAGTDWCLDVAMRVAPARPEAWDLATVVGAAFARHVRRASDFGGGRRIYQD